MKKILLSLTAGLIAFASLAQPGGKSANPINLDNSSLAKLNSLDEPSTAKSLSASNIKAVKAFRKSFKDVAGERWFAGADGFTAKFETPGTQNRVEFDKRGRWVATFKYYGEKLMPKDVRTRVKSTYFDYTISQVIEIHYKDAIAYIVQIKDENEFKNIRVVGDEMDVMEEFKNANK